MDESVALGAKYVSNSYGSQYSPTPGSGEDPSQVTEAEAHFNHPGVAIVASSGDSNYGVSYPAASQYVTAVGGTSLVRDSSARGWSESVWSGGTSGAGSGCSLYEAKPAWQHDTGCDKRTVADVAAVADPATGVAVYDSYQQGGWNVFGGTSASAPIIAGVYAAGTPVKDTYPASYPYANSYTAKFAIGTDTPYSTPVLPVSMTVAPPKTWGKITGIVTGPAAPLPGAVVQVTTSGAHYTLVTDASGHYQLWADARNPLQVICADDGYQSQMTTVRIRKGATTTLNFALQKV
ncbi:carboxypeptidase regulatory-like domain-containing protein [Streptomyces sp. NPDC004012]